MVKRIVSGIFALAALAALGVIIGGALASGEQLIVRFLTAVIVAALALYVISDLRLKAQPASELDPGRSVEHPPTKKPASLPTNASILESTVLTVDMPPDNRDLQPAARTIDVAHPVRQPQPTTTAHLVSPTAAGDETEAPLFAEPMSNEIKTDDIDLTRLTDQPLETPVSAVDLSEAAVVETKPEIANGDQPDDAAVYVAVGAHNYEGGLETPAANWPATPIAAERSTDTAGVETLAASALAETRPVPGLPLNPTTATQGQTPEPEDDVQPTTVVIDESPEVVRTGLPITEDVTKPLVQIDASTIEDTPSIIDLARTTASYAGPVHTPVIDLREPITDELPAAPKQPAEPEQSEPTGQVSAPSLPTLHDHPPAADASQTPSDTLTGSGATPVPAIGSSTTAAASQARPPQQTERSSTGGSPSVPSRDDRIAAAIAGGERKVIETLIRQGMLTTGGPITDRDVRTMVYVAFTSNELRKIIMAGGRVNTGEATLGPVELFDESVFQPVPQTVYTGPPPVDGLPSPASAGLIQKPMIDEHKKETPV